MTTSFSKCARYLMLFIVSGIWISCKTSDALTEPIKNIEGTWKLEKALRNNEDITSVMDAAGFQIVFERNGAAYESGSYKITNDAPFMVSEDGTWQLDDPAYPFFLALKPQSGSAATPIKFFFPSKKGSNEMQLTFSPGCSGNTYQYSLRRAE